MPGRARGAVVMIGLNCGLLMVLGAAGTGAGGKTKKGMQSAILENTGK